MITEYQNGALQATYAHGLGLAAGEINGQRAFYDGDAVGSVTTVTDDTGAVANRYAYTPFGTELLEVEAIPNDFEFNGLFGSVELSDELTLTDTETYSDALGRLYAIGQDLPIGTPITPFDESFAAPPLIDNSPINGYYNYAPLFDHLYIRPRTALENFVSSIPVVGKGFNIIAIPAEGFSVYWQLNNKNLSHYDKAMASEYISDKWLQFTQIFTTLIKFKIPVLDRWELPISIGLPVSKLLDPLIKFGTVSSLPIHPAADTASSDGDPHLRTFDDLGYSFQAVGEFILFRTQDGASEFQVRQEPWGSRDTVSANTAITAQLGNAAVGIYAGQSNPLVVNGTIVVLESGETLAVGTGSVYFDGRAYIITDEHGNGVWAKPYTSQQFMNLRPFVGEDSLGNIEGLLGNADGDRSNDFALRDGTVLAQPLAQTQLYGEFADSWRISQDESLFVYADGETTQTFTDRSFPANVVTLDDLDPAERADAEAVALAAGLEPGTFTFETTVLDIALTGVTEFAEAAAEEPFVNVDTDNHRRYLDAGDTSLVIDGGDSLILDFGGTDSYQLQSALSRDVTIVDNQLSRVLLPEDSAITSAQFLPDGLALTLGGHSLKLLGAPQTFVYVLNEAELNYTELAGALGSERADTEALDLEALSGTGSDWPL